MQRPQYSSSEHSASRCEHAGRLAQACAGVIRAYQLVLRPLFPPACRFAPSCSEYSRTALLAHGFLRGGVLAFGRVVRCHAWHPGGYDPVPTPKG